jgi:hypothetical protein
MATTVESGGSTTIRSEMLHFRLSQKLGGTVKKVELVYHIPHDATRMVRVLFQNGRSLDHPEHLLFTDEFHALCVMIQDLPED